MSVSIGPKTPGQDDSKKDDLASEVVRRHSESITGRPRSSSEPLPAVAPGEQTASDAVQKAMDEAATAKRLINGLPASSEPTGPPISKAHKAVGTMGTVMGLASVVGSKVQTIMKIVAPTIAASGQFLAAVPIVSSIAGGLTIAATLSRMFAERDPGVDFERIKDENDFLKIHPKFDSWWTRASANRRLAADILTMLSGGLAMIAPFFPPAAPVFLGLSIGLQLVVFALDPLRTLVPIEKFVLRPMRWLGSKAAAGAKAVGKAAKAGWEKTKDFGSEVADKAGQAWDATKDKASDFWDYMKGKASAAADRIKSGVESGVEKVKAGASSVANWARGKANQFSNWINPAISEGGKADGDTTGPWVPQAWEAERRDEWAKLKVDDAITRGAMVFVNGVNTNLQEHNIRAQALADQTGQPVVGVWNASGKGHSAVGQFVDWAQSVTDKLGIGDNPATKKLVELIEAHGAGIKLYGHSQGSIIISDAMSRVKKKKGVEGIQNLDVTTFGNAAATMPEGAKSYQHFVFDSDPISGSVGSTSLLNQFFLGNPLSKAILQKMGWRSTLQDTYTMHSSSGFARAHGVVQDPVEKDGKVQRGRDGKVITDNEDSYIAALPRFLQEKQAADAQRAKFAQFGIDSTAFLPLRQTAGMGFGLARSLGNAAVDNIGKAYNFISPGVQQMSGMEGEPIGQGLDFLLRGAGQAVEGTGNLIGKGWDWLMGMNDPQKAVQRMGFGPVPEVHPDRLRAGLLAAEGPGAPIPSSAQMQVGGLLGDDLDQARIHTGPAAARAASALSANAFTIGPDVFFGGGKYQPHSAEGMGLLGHELTHVVQQSRGSVGISGDIGFGSLEKAAQWIGALVKRLFGSKPEASVGQFDVDYVDESGGHRDFGSRIETISGMALEEALRRINALKLPAKRIELLQVDVELDLEGMSNTECAAVWAEAIVAAVGVQARATATAAIPKTIQRDEQKESKLSSEPSDAESQPWCEDPAAPNASYQPAPERHEEKAEAPDKEVVLKAFETEVRSRVADRINLAIAGVNRKLAKANKESGTDREQDFVAASKVAQQVIAKQAAAKALNNQIKSILLQNRLAYASSVDPETGISLMPPPDLEPDPKLSKELAIILAEAEVLIRSNALVVAAISNDDLESLAKGPQTDDFSDETTELTKFRSNLLKAEEKVWTMKPATFKNDVADLLSGQGKKYKYNTEPFKSWIEQEQKHEQRSEIFSALGMLVAQIALGVGAALTVEIPPLSAALAVTDFGLTAKGAVQQYGEYSDLKQVNTATAHIGRRTVDDGDVTTEMVMAGMSVAFAFVDAAFLAKGVGELSKAAKAMDEAAKARKEVAVATDLGKQAASEAKASRRVLEASQEEKIASQAADDAKKPSRLVTEGSKRVRRKKLAALTEELKTQEGRDQFVKRAVRRRMKRWRSDHPFVPGSTDAEKAALKAQTEAEEELQKALDEVKEIKADQIKSVPKEKITSTVETGADLTKTATEKEGDAEEEKSPSEVDPWEREDSTTKTPK